MRVGYQGEGRSYSDRAVKELFPDGERIGHPSFAAAFHSLRDGEVDRLVLPIENSTTGSVLPVLDRLTKSRARIVGEHLVEVRHALIGVPGATLDDIETVHSHPQALAQADDRIEQAGWLPMPTHDTAGAVRLLADHRDPSEAALAPPEAAESHGLEVLATNFMDRDHNTTRFVVLALEPVEIAVDANKTSFVFATAHTPGALALSLTELGLRGANLTRLESRPADEAWKYRFFADMVHEPGEEGLKTILDPQPATMTDVNILGTYSAAPRG
jgi:prephenate dehydratase